jgi:hypothetical protein
MDRISLDRVLTNHFGQSGSGLSPRLWSRIPKRGTGPDGTSGVFVGDDFTKFAGVLATSGAAVTLPSATAGGVSGYRCYLDIGSSLTTAADVAGGVLVMAADTTDNDLAVIATGDLCEISRTAGEEKLTIFECRVALPTQVTTGSTAIGLGSTEIQADGGLVVDTGEVLATADFIGFRTLDADPDGIDFVYQENGSAVQVTIDALQVATAGTYYKLGFVYDPTAPASQRIAVYLDGEVQSTYVTDTNMAASTFPNSAFLALVAAIKSDGGSAARTMNVDWWAAYQEV